MDIECTKSMNTSKSHTLIKIYMLFINQQLHFLLNLETFKFTLEYT